jgi:hypothetical protein
VIPITAEFELYSEMLQKGIREKSGANPTPQAPRPALSAPAGMLSNIDRGESAQLPLPQPPSSGTNAGAVATEQIFAS